MEKHLATEAGEMVNELVESYRGSINQRPETIIRKEKNLKKRVDGRVSEGGMDRMQVALRCSTRYPSGPSYSARQIVLHYTKHGEGTHVDI